MDEVDLLLQLVQDLLDKLDITKGIRPVFFIEAPSTKVSMVSKTIG